MNQSSDPVDLTKAAPPPPYAGPPPAYEPPTYAPSSPSYDVPAAPPNPYGVRPVDYLAIAPVGKVRNTAFCILLTIVTFGIYPLIWYFQVHKEMKQHDGQGIGGGVALLLAFFIGIVMPYVTASEVGELHRRAGRSKPVTGLTGLWYFPGALILIGPLVWFVKTNRALNDYWRSLGA